MLDINSSDLRISGYASLFAQTDMGGDSVHAGAFAASLLTLKDGRLPMLFGHKTDEPIGVWDQFYKKSRTRLDWT